MTAVTGGRRVRAWVLNLGDSGAKTPPHPQARGRKFKRLNGGAGVGRRRVRADRQRPARSARLETDALSARAPHRCPVCKPRTGGCGTVAPVRIGQYGTVCPMTASRRLEVLQDLVGLPAASTDAHTRRRFGHIEARGRTSRKWAEAIPQTLDRVQTSEHDGVVSENGQQSTLSRSHFFQRPERCKLTTALNLSDGAGFSGW